MTTAQTTNKGLYTITPTTEVDTWGPPLNDNATVIDLCLGTVSIISVTGTNAYVLSQSEYRATTVIITGTLDPGNVTVNMPAGVGAQLTFVNETTGTSASSLLISWTAVSSLDSQFSYVPLPQNSTQFLIGNGATNNWYPASPTYSSASSAIDSISLTGLSTYALSSVDTASNVIKFTGTLGNSTTVIVSVSATTTGQWTFVNSTTAGSGVSRVGLTQTVHAITVTGATGDGTDAFLSYAAISASLVPPIGSIISVSGMNPAGYNGSGVVKTSSTTQLSYANTTSSAFVSGGTIKPLYILNQNSTQVLYADSAQVNFSSSAPQSFPLTTSIDLTGNLPSTYFVSEEQARNTVWFINGTVQNGNVTLLFPSSAVGLYTFYNNWSAAGGSTTLLLGWVGGGGGQQLTSSSAVNILLGSRNPANLAQGKWSVLTITP